MCATSLNDSQGCLNLLTPGLHFTHLQYSLSFSDKPRFCHPWYFTVTMYFSDSPTGSKWSLAPFNSNIAFGSRTEVCHCSFYFGGSGMHKAWKTTLGRHQHKSDLVIFLLTTSPWFPIILETLVTALKNLPELMPPSPTNCNHVVLLSRSAQSAMTHFLFCCHLELISVTTLG